MENKPGEITIVESADGSHTLFHEGLKETYHSMHGAVQESEHVFIQAGLKDQLTTEKKEIRIFEVGFGTGFNAWLTYKYSACMDVKIVYHTLEPYPLGEEIYSKLNYTGTTEDKDLHDFFVALHQVPWDKEVELADNFSLKKINLPLEVYTPLKESFDLVYYDAFAPSKQAEMWLPGNIQKVYWLLMKGGTFVTYCAKGQVKRDLKEVGFQVETLPGPPGKKEMTRGRK